MGFFSKTPDDPGAIGPAPAPDIDTEKQDVSQIELGDGDANVPGMVPFHVTPEMEKRVVRKLDRRLVPLVMGLCKYWFSVSWILDFQSELRLQYLCLCLLLVYVDTLSNKS